MLNGNHNYEDISEDHKEAVQKKLQACLVDGPASFKEKVLSYVHEFGYLLSPDKLSICVETIRCFELLSIPSDEEQRAINLVWEMEQHDANCVDCVEGESIGAMILEALMRQQVEDKDYNAENN